MESPKHQGTGQETTGRDSVYFLQIHRRAVNVAEHMTKAGCQTYSVHVFLFMMSRAILRDLCVFIFKTPFKNVL